MSLARAYAGLKRNEEAVAQTDTALAAVPFDVDAVSAVGVHYRAAAIFARVGDAGRAAEMMELLLDRSTGTTPAELRADPELDAISADPRIRDLIGS